jgi:hypothetical protein
MVMLEMEAEHLHLIPALVAAMDRSSSTGTPVRLERLFRHLPDVDRDFPTTYPFQSAQLRQEILINLQVQDYILFRYGAQAEPLATGGPTIMEDREINPLAR